MEKRNATNKILIEKQQFWYYDKDEYEFFEICESSKSIRMDGQITVMYKNNNDKVITKNVVQTELYPKSIGNPLVLNDLTQLSYLNLPEDAILIQDIPLQLHSELILIVLSLNLLVLHYLQQRYINRSIYTWCGIVLVAINPYTEMPLYGQDVINDYSSKDLTSLDPHLFSVVQNVCQKMKMQVIFYLKYY
ncbi:hypothetical protein GJ496_007296 [Pomphorhynchus laevis]|nr:hypothetical protein GJ496_007296 [Pomphorhynchus laevis]